MSRTKHPRPARKPALPDQLPSKIVLHCIVGGGRLAPFHRMRSATIVEQRVCRCCSIRWIIKIEPIVARVFGEGAVHIVTWQKAVYNPTTRSADPAPNREPVSTHNTADGEQIGGTFYIPKVQS